eukprot:gb/GECG01010328.1/.p1 GENE.gb/GECG01010328.1/~~gb/GECG01010328.1/.p1  ORF type:complete len:440 (+),score=32.99 gb/GECG01010328.1/:1-1320(+)
MDDSIACRQNAKTSSHVAKNALFGAAVFLSLILVTLWVYMTDRLFQAEDMHRREKWMAGWGKTAAAAEHERALNREGRHMQLQNGNISLSPQNAMQSNSRNVGNDFRQGKHDGGAKTSNLHGARDTHITRRSVQGTGSDHRDNHDGRGTSGPFGPENGKVVSERTTLPEMTIYSAMRKKLMTIVSGYFEIPGMPHHPASYFHDSIPSTLRWLRENGANVVYYHNLNLQTHPLGEVLNRSGVHLRKIELQELPGGTVSGNLRKLCIRWKVTEVPHMRLNKCKDLYDRLKKFDSYYHVLSVWFSKLPFLDEVVRTNPFESVYFGWFDCGIVNRLSADLSRNILRPDVVGTPRSSMHYGPKNMRVGHRMGLVAGTADKIRELARLHQQKTNKILYENVPMCYDEEIVLAELLQDHSLNPKAEGLVHYFKKAPPIGTWLLSIY